MHDHVNSAQAAGDRSSIAKVDDGDGRTRDGGGRWHPMRGGMCGVENGHGVTVRTKGSRHVGSDETGAAGHEHMSHDAEGRPGRPAMRTVSASRQRFVRSAHPSLLCKGFRAGTGDTLPSMTDVVLPCLNEAPALPWVLTRMPAGFHPLVVDNGSTDGSADVARAHGVRVISVSQPGYGAAVHGGLIAADPDDGVVCVLDADGSFDPQELPRLTVSVRAGTADLVVGRRRPTCRRAWPLHARLGNALLARRLRRTTGLPVHDIGPIRAARRADLLSLDLQDRRFGYPLELLVAAQRASWRVHEIDVPYHPRASGTHSKVTGTVRGTVRAVRDMRAVLSR